MDRRTFLRLSAAGLVASAGATSLGSCVIAPVPTDPGLADYGPLLAADANGLKLPAGFSSRIVATTGQAVADTGYVWHANPDGGACFPAAGGGWIYVSNDESSSPNGGASMVRFDAAGVIVEARRILSGTARNCAGGVTPWGTWLSCEEVSTGLVWECDPTGATAAVARPAMGRFNHEAAVADTVREVFYLTEDATDGLLYRFRPTTWGDLSTGTLEALTDTGGTLGWAAVADPDGSPTATRNQVTDAKRFNGGEGICMVDSLVYFTTKGDNRVWCHDASNNTLTVVYDDNTSSPANLTGVDNVTATDRGLFVAEDGGNMQIVLVNRWGTGENVPFLEVTGAAGSEITGPAFSPDGGRLYFSSQRYPGRTYEVTGPF